MFLFNRFVECQLEKGEESGRLHWQGVIKMEYAVTLKRIKEILKTHGGHFENMRGTFAQAIAYVRKEESQEKDAEGERIFFQYGIEPVTSDEKQGWHDVMQAGSYSEAVEIVKDNMPRDFVLYKEKIQQNMSKLFEEKVEPKFDLKRFLVPPIGVNLLQRFSIIMSGDAGIGKTNFALAHFDRPLLVRHLDRCADINWADYDGVIFDDVDLSRLPATELIHLFDLDFTSEIHVRYKVAVIPPKFPRIFTTNIRTKGEMFDHITNAAQKDAIYRRVSWHRYQNKMFSDPDDDVEFIAAENYDRDIVAVPVDLNVTD